MSNQKIKSITTLKELPIELSNKIIESNLTMLQVAQNNPEYFSIEYHIEPKKPKNKALFIFKILTVNREYWFINSRGVVEKCWWIGNEADIARFNLNNVFLTEENAQKQADKLKLLAEIERFAVENNDEIDWGNGYMDKWYLLYGHGFKHWEAVSHNLFIPNTTYFSSETLATQALEKFKNRLPLLLDTTTDTNIKNDGNDAFLMEE